MMGTLEIERVREYLVETLTEAGLEPETLTVETPDYFRAPGGTVDVTDVLVRIPGSGDGEAILFMAHYDTVPTMPGANDNSTAVAALLEVGRVLASEPTPPNDVILLFTDGEEPTPLHAAGCFLGAAERGVRRRSRDASAVARFPVLTNIQLPSIQRPFRHSVNEILAARSPIWTLMPLEFGHRRSALSLSAAPKTRPPRRPIVSFGWRCDRLTSRF